MTIDSKFTTSDQAINTGGRNPVRKFEICGTLIRDLIFNFRKSSIPCGTGMYFGQSRNSKTPGNQILRYDLRGGCTPLLKSAAVIFAFFTKNL